MGPQSRPRWAGQAVELRAVGQGGESVAQVSLGVAVEVPLAGESVPTGKDGQGDDLTLKEGGFGAGVPLWRMGLAEVDRGVLSGSSGPVGVCRSASLETTILAEPFRELD